MILDLKNIEHKTTRNFITTIVELTPEQLGVLDADLFDLQNQGTNVRFTVSPWKDDVDPQKIHGNISLDTSPHMYGSSQTGPHLQLNMATMCLWVSECFDLCPHSVGEHVAAVGKPHHKKKGNK